MLHQDCFVAEGLRYIFFTAILALTIYMKKKASTADLKGVFYQTQFSHQRLCAQMIFTLFGFHLYIVFAHKIKCATFIKLVQGHAISTTY